MRRIIFTVLALTLLTGVASADRWRGRGGRGHDTSWASGGTVVRDHRGGREWRNNDRSYTRDYDRGYRQERRVFHRRPVYVSNNRFVFANGYARVYNRPVIRHRYYDVRVRPEVFTENYDPVPGYIWVAGRWDWNGYEWIWINGYYAVDTSYDDDYYTDHCNDGNYYNY